MILLNVVVYILALFGLIVVALLVGVYLTDKLEKNNTNGYKEINSFKVEKEYDTYGVSIYAKENQYSNDYHLYVKGQHSFGERRFSVLDDLDEHIERLIKDCESKAKTKKDNEDEIERAKMYEYDAVDLPKGINKEV